MIHTLLFSGHLIDAKYRPVSRFPAVKKEAARQAIRHCLWMEKEKGKPELKGIAGAASGGDILFLEGCIEVNIPAEIYLSLPADQFKQASVSGAGKDWEDRFDQLISKLPVHKLPEVIEEGSVWERANLWMLDNALVNGGENMTLIALWDGKGGDGPGGAGHMVKVAKEQGATVKIIKIGQL